MVTISILLTDEGEQYRSEGLPERQLYQSFKDSVQMAELMRHPHARIGLGWMKRLNWVKIDGGLVTKTGSAEESILEKALLQPEAADGTTQKELINGGLQLSRRRFSTVF